MPQLPFVGNQSFDPETLACMSIAFEAVCEDLGLRGATGGATEIVAKRVVELAGDDHDPKRLREAVLASFKLDRLLA
jgi:hypothetical protein